VVQALLVVILVMCVVFVWRTYARRPAPAALAGAVAAALGVILLRNPALAILGVTLAVYLIYHTSSRK
jgi:hypothetical protein